MTCPECNGKTIVIYSRAAYGGMYRRRRCLNCNYIYYTEELEVDSDRENEVKKFLYTRNGEK